MNEIKLEELIKNIEECEYECLAGNLKQNINWIELKEKASKIDEIIWSWRHGNFASCEEVIKEIDDLFD